MSLLYVRGGAVEEKVTDMQEVRGSNLCKAFNLKEIKCGEFL